MAQRGLAQIKQEVLDNIAGDAQTMTALQGLAENGLSGDASGDVGAIVQASIGADGAIDANNLVQHLVGYVQDMEDSYRGVLAGAQAAIDARPNNAQTLYGNSAALGATYAGNTAIPGFTKVAGQLAGTAGFTCYQTMRLLSMVTDPVDAAAGWRIVGNSLTIGTDPVTPFSFDLSFSMFLPTVRVEDHPTARLYNRRFRTPTTLNVSFMHNNAAATSLIAGVTFNYFDSKCLDTTSFDNAMEPNDALGTDFPSAVPTLIAMATAGARGQAQGMRAALSAGPAFSLAPSNQRAIMGAPRRVGLAAAAPNAALRQFIQNSKLAGATFVR